MQTEREVHACTSVGLVEGAFLRAGPFIGGSSVATVADFLCYSEVPQCTPPFSSFSSSSINASSLTLRTQLAQVARFGKVLDLAPYPKVRVAAAW